MLIRPRSMKRKIIGEMTQIKMCGKLLAVALDIYHFFYCCLRYTKDRSSFCSVKVRLQKSWAYY